MNYGDYAYIEYFPNGMFQTRPDTGLGRQQQIFQVWIRPLRSNNDAHFATRTAVLELDKLIAKGMTESDFEATWQFLSRSVSLMTDGQSRQLGYAMESQYYEIEDFASYVRDELNDLTLADINRVIRENLDTDNMQYVFVTRDAKGLRQRLVGDLVSRIVYEATMSEELIEEDWHIEALGLGFDARDVRIVSYESIFN
jgi:zinc protease